MTNNTSPAVASLQNERALRSAADPLEAGLKDTFPASDPVSATTTSIPSGVGGRPDISTISDAPRVDEALQSILAHRDDPYVGPREQLAALKDEVESLRFRAAADVRSRIRSNPWRAVGLAAVVGFVIGIIR